MKRKIGLLCVIFLLVITLFPFCVSGEEGSTTYHLNSGISISLPEEYSNQVSKDSAGLKNIEFQSWQEETNNNIGHQVIISQYEALNALTNQSLFDSYCQNNEIDYLSSVPKLGYGVVKIKGISFFKIFFESEEDNFKKAYVYLLLTNDGLIHEISFINHGVKTSAYYVDSLTYQTMSTIGLSDELVKKVVDLDGEYFTMLNGRHNAVFNFEETDKKITPTPVVSLTETPYQKFISFEFPMWIILVGLIVLLFYGVKFSKKDEFFIDALSLDSTRKLQGFFALAIIIHHLAQKLLDKAGVLSFFSEIGVLFVGAFFFFSGYGLYTSLKTKDGYLNTFLKKRLVSVLVPLYVSILIFLLFALIKGDGFSLPELVATISGWLLINDHMWYVVEISILYIAFYIIYRFINNRKLATVIMTIFVLLMMTGSFLLGHGADLSSKYWFMGEWWYNATLCFVLGIVISQNSEKLKSFASKYYKLLLPLLIALTIGFGYLTSYAIETWSYWNEYPGYPGYKEKFLCLIIQAPWIIFFVILLVLIMMKTKFSNRGLKFLGSISLELYLIHNLFVKGLKDGSFMTIRSSSLYILLVILLSIASAVIINGLDKYIINSILNKSSKVETKDERIHSIDVLRIIMAFLVVCIHIPFKGKAGEIFITFGKLAVPFFLITCGYFLYRDNSEEMMKRLKKQTIRIFILYLTSNVLYAVAYFIRLNKDNLSFYLSTKQIYDFLLYNMSPFSEHLWFLGSLLYALVILMLLNKLKVINYAMYIAPLLIGTYVVLSYLGFWEAYVLRNVILVGLPYTMMGMLIHRYEDKLMKIKTELLWFLAILLSIGAIVELNYRSIEVPFISIELLVYVVVLLCLKYPNFGANTMAEKIGRDLSLPIYIFHILIMMILEKIIPINEGLLSNYGAITVFVLTALLITIIKYLFRIITKSLKKNNKNQSYLPL